LEAQLARLKARGLFRDPEDAWARAEVREQAERAGVAFLDVTSNDYLGLARGAVTRADVSRETALGAGASRLVQGTHAEHEALELALAEWVGMPTALLFSSGFAANVGVVSALADAGSVVVSDALNHASLIDGCRLSRAQVAVVPHRDLRAVDAALAGARGAVSRWVVTESYFSMDGDIADLRALRALCDRHRAYLIVDESHALGVFGPEGGGRCRLDSVQPEVVIGGLGKAVGAQGGFAAGSDLLRAYLWNRARSFVFSTAPSPSLSASTLANLRVVQSAERERAHLHELCASLRQELLARGLPIVADSVGPIVPLFGGPGTRVMDLALHLRRQGILAQPIRPPTVPEGFSRLRLSLNARLTLADVQRLADAVDQAWRETPAMETALQLD